MKLKDETMSKRSDNSGGNSVSVRKPVVTSNLWHEALRERRRSLNAGSLETKFTENIKICAVTTSQFRRRRHRAFDRFNHVLNWDLRKFIIGSEF